MVVGAVRVVGCARISFVQEMKVFSASIHCDAGQPLGGYAGERLSDASCGSLELNGFEFVDVESGESVELCSVDTLYAGELVDTDLGGVSRRIFAASHTHYAPMLDATKPKLGKVCGKTLEGWRQAVTNAPRHAVKPTMCTVWRAEVDVPIYRRFDVPDSAVNRWLTKHAGMYPNSAQKIDRNLYLFELGGPDRTDLVIAFHACHPVSRADPSKISADYVGELRRAVRSRFGQVPCLFLLGCSGDIRPNFWKKRISWLPVSRLNKRFEWPVTLASQDRADQVYANAVLKAQKCKTLEFNDEEFKLEYANLPLVNQPMLRIPRIRLGEHLSFEFVPFEVSHLFHLDAHKKDPMRFIVSCADRTLGYLAHPSQIAAGGYEVDGSRQCMQLSSRVLLKGGRLW